MSLPAGWLDRERGLSLHLADARATFLQLGHRGDFVRFPGSRRWAAVCVLCGARAEARMRGVDRQPLGGAALTLRCDPRKA